MLQCRGPLEAAVASSRGRLDPTTRQALDESGEATLMAGRLAIAFAQTNVSLAKATPASNRSTPTGKSVNEATYDAYNTPQTLRSTCRADAPRGRCGQLRDHLAANAPGCCARFDRAT